MTTQRQRRSAALKAIVTAFLELAALEQEEDEGGDRPRNRASFSATMPTSCESSLPTGMTRIVQSRRPGSSRSPRGCPAGRPYSDRRIGPRDLAIDALVVVTKEADARLSASKKVIEPGGVADPSRVTPMLLEPEPGGRVMDQHDIDAADGAQALNLFARVVTLGIPLEAVPIVRRSSAPWMLSPAAQKIIRAPARTVGDVPSSSSRFVDKPPEQTPVTSLGVRAGGRAEQRDRLSGCNASGEGCDRFPLLLHLREVTKAELGPLDGRPALSVKGGMQLAARTELWPPRDPGLRVLAHASRTVAADEQAVPVVGLDGVVPTLGLDGHRPGLNISLSARVSSRRKRWPSLP
jgi:hypothetical protein